jgi:hypothetical protein
LGFPFRLRRLRGVTVLDTLEQVFDPLRGIPAFEEWRVSFKHAQQAAK